MLPPGGRSTRTKNTSSWMLRTYCSSAAVHLSDKIVQSRVGSKAMGFDTRLNMRQSEVPVSELLRETQPEDLVHFGMIPEFIGRLPMVAVLDELSRSDLEHILQNTKNSLVKQYGKLFLMDGAQLHFTRDAISAIADKAIALKTGARALRSIWSESCSTSCMTFLNSRMRRRLLSIVQSSRAGQIHSKQEPSEVGKDSSEGSDPADAV